MAIQRSTEETDPLPVDRYADLKAFVAEWHRPIELGDGYSEAEIAEAETRLGFRLPEALRELYTLIGKMGVMNAATVGFVAPKDWQIYDEPLSLDSRWHGEDAEAENGLWFWQESDPFDSFAVKLQSREVGEECWFRNDGNGWAVEESLRIGDAALLIAASAIVARGRFSAIVAPEPSWDEETVTVTPFVFSQRAGTRLDDPHPALEYLHKLTREPTHPLLARHDYKLLDDCLCAIEDEYVCIVARNEESLNALITKHPDLHWLINSNNSAEL